MLQNERFVGTDQVYERENAHEPRNRRSARRAGGSEAALVLHTCAKWP